MPALAGGDDSVGVCAPVKGLRLRVAFDDEAIDGGLQVDHRDERAALQSPFGELGEESLDGVEPGARCRREVEREAPVAAEPGADLRMLVSGIIVEDHMHGFALRRGGVDGVQEADELLMAMALHVAADHGAIEHVEGGEQRCRAVALVIVGHGADMKLEGMSTGAPETKAADA